MKTTEKLKISLCSGLITFLCGPMLTAQAGGQAKTIHRYWGNSTLRAIGGNVAGVGDVNGDGFPDFLYNISRTQAGGINVCSGLTGDNLIALDGVADFDLFGISAAGVGDLDGDGLDDFVIGAPHTSPGGLFRAGSVYAYSGGTGAVIYQWDGMSPVDYFGYSVDGAGDVNADGISDVIVGMPAEDTASTGAGAAFIYSGATGALLHQLSYHHLFDAFGGAVAGIGDVDQDGFDDVLVGSYLFSQAVGQNPGAITVFSGSTGSELYQIVGTDLAGLLGLAVSGCADLDGDSVPDFLAGAPFADAADFDAGIAFAFSGATGAEIFSWSGEGGSDYFGRSLAGLGDVDGDHLPDILIGAEGAAPGARHSAGAAYLYSGATGSLLHRFEGAKNQDSLGATVADVGDVNGDGLYDFIVGAPLADPNGVTNAGSVFVYSFNPFLVASTYAIPAAAGTSLDLTLDFPDLAAFNDYMVLMSVSGNGPLHYGVDIPLSADSMLLQTSQGIYPFASFSGLQGSLDAFGNGVASISFPPGFGSSYVGQSFWLAAVAMQPGQLPGTSSVSIPFEIVP